MKYYYKLKNNPHGLFFSTFDSETMLSNCTFSDPLIDLFVATFIDGNISFSFKVTMNLEEFKEHILFVTLSI